MGKFVTNASGAICWESLQLMQVAPSGGQICNICNWRHLVAIFATNASGAIWWPTNVSGAILLPTSIQDTESISGSVVPLAMFVCVCVCACLCMFVYVCVCVFGSRVNCEAGMKCQSCKTNCVFWERLSGVLMSTAKVKTKKKCCENTYEKTKTKENTFEKTKKK